MSTLDLKNREEISQLLPWYANGTLSEAECERVEAALDADEQLRAEFDLVLEDQVATIDLVSEEPVPASMEQRFKVSLNQMQSQAQQAPVSPLEPETSGFIERMVAMLFPTRAVAYMAVAAALLLVVQSGAIVSLISDDLTGRQFQTASGPGKQSAAGIQFLVQFNGDASMTNVSKFLKDNDGRLAGGPSADGFYTLEFSPGGDTSAPKLQTLLEEKSDLFAIVLVAN